MGPLSLETVFSTQTPSDFEALALKVFRYQYQNNPIYQSYCKHLKKEFSSIKKVTDIPFLPISFFKSHRVMCTDTPSEMTFTSSGTTGSIFSKHHILDLKWYETSFYSAFQQFYGDPQDWCILALLPSYLERKGSSLVYMVNALIKKSQNANSGFYLDDLKSLHQTLRSLEQRKIKSLLIGVSFALLDFVEKFPMQLNHTTVMETGGMKGRRKERIREDLHASLKKGFGVKEIHSEYGMTELLSQAYSKGAGRFHAPNWMKVFTRDAEDPLQLQKEGKTGGINIIDLANLHSCSFIATQDLGKVYANGSFEVLGRFDNSDVRGCNLMVL